MKALLIIFSLLLVLLLAGLWVGPGSYPHLWKLENRKVLQEQSNTEKKEQIRKIQAELDDVASGKDALEERARSELGMTKKGETFFEVVLQPKPKKESKTVNGSTTVSDDKKDSPVIDSQTGND
ncbi:UNVERIFIED_CONTAM: hypothetical protein GTU68_018165 [Idotea baltica]|nr:hypothetical protein [Idotea baltica]